MAGVCFSGFRHGYFICRFRGESHADMDLWWQPGRNPRDDRKSVSFGNTVSGTSLRAETDSSFPQSGLIAAISAAMRGEFDLLQLLALELLGNKSKAAQMVELFQNYGVSVRSVSSCRINSS